jgi:hypothetical protein
MELPIISTCINFSCHHFSCFTVASLFVLDKSTAWNRCLQHPCFKNLCKIARASKNSDSNAQHFLSDLLTHLWFHSMLFALPGYQFPYTVMNRCFYLSGRFSQFIASPLLQLDSFPTWMGLEFLFFILSFYIFWTNEVQKIFLLHPCYAG